MIDYFNRSFLILLNSQLLETFYKSSKETSFPFILKLPRVSRLNILFPLGKSKFFFFTAPHKLSRCICQKTKKSSDHNTEITVLINSCICRRTTAPDILAIAYQAELLHSENFSYLRRNVMITGLTLTPRHRQGRTVNVLELYSCLWKEF